MKIVDIKAYPTSFRVPKENQVSLGIGTMIKRDCVMVKVTTDDGIVGWGESHHARPPGGIGELSRRLWRASDPEWMRLTIGIWANIYASSSAATAWARRLPGDERHRHGPLGHQRQGDGLPLYKLLGGTNKPVPVYAGGISLGYQPPEVLVDEAVWSRRLQGNQAPGGRQR